MLAFKGKGKAIPLQRLRLAVLISVTDRVNTRAVLRLVELGHRKIPTTPSGIEPVTPPPRVVALTTTDYGSPYPIFGG